MQFDGFPRPAQRLNYASILPSSTVNQIVVVHSGASFGRVIGISIIEIRYSKKFGGAWSVREAPGVEPAFPGPNEKQKALEYARSSRFGGSRGEIRVYDEAGENIVETIAVDGGSRYDQRHRS